MTVGLMAAFADGDKSDVERAEVKRITDTLPEASANPAAVYQRVLLRQITVADAAAPTLTLTPASIVIGVGGTQQFVAVYDPDGSGPASPQSIAGTQASWKSSNLLAVIVDKTGLGKGWRAGSAKVKATYAGLTASADITVGSTPDPPTAPPDEPPPANDVPGPTLKLLPGSTVVGNRPSSPHPESNVRHANASARLCVETVTTPLR